jgi:hypothetical protein
LYARGYITQERVTPLVPEPKPKRQRMKKSLIVCVVVSV